MSLYVQGIQCHEQDANCSYAAGLEATGVLAMVGSVLGLAPCAVTCWLRYTRRHLAWSAAERVAFWITIHMCIRVVFWALLLSGVLNDAYLAVAMLDGLIWPAVYLGYYEYVLRIVTACPPPRLTSAQLKRWHRFTRFGCLAVCTVTLGGGYFLAALAGGMQASGQHTVQLFAIQGELLLHAALVIFLMVLIWRFGGRLQRLAKHRRTLQAQFDANKSARVPLSILLHTTPQQMRPQSSELGMQQQQQQQQQQHRGSRAALDAGIQRLKLLNLSALLVGIFFGVQLTVYGIALPFIYQQPLYHLLASVAFNVIGELAMVVLQAFLATSFYRQHRRELQEHRQATAATPDKASADLGVYELPTLYYDPLPPTAEGDVELADSKVRELDDDKDDDNDRHPLRYPHYLHP